MGVNGWHAPGGDCGADLFLDRAAVPLHKDGGSKTSPMQLTSSTLSLPTSGPGLYELTDQVRAQVAACGAHDGQITLFCRHTSASLVIQENADPDVLRDLQTFFEGIAPRMAAYRHDTEGPDDMPAHIKSALTQSSLSIPILGGRLALGTWQGVYLFEHRDRPHQREIIVQVLHD